MTDGFRGRVALVTGAGQGLGRSHALALAQRGAKVLVNDRAGATTQVPNAAEQVVDEIRRNGGEAFAFDADVADFAQIETMVGELADRWGRLDILVNNAGILRDKSFAKLSLDDFRKVMEVHLMGAVHCCKAAWPLMQAQGYGRIVMTTSASGLYGNFGQSNYAAAKMALIGLMNVLHCEGAKFDIRVNALSPVAATPMMEGLVPEDMWRLISPEAVSPALLFLTGAEAPSRVIMSAGAGGYAVVQIKESRGIFLGEADRTPESIAARFAEIADSSTDETMPNAAGQGFKFYSMATAAETF